MKISMVVLVVVIAMCVAMISGCQAVPAFCRDIGGAANWTADMLTPMADQARARDAKLSAKELARYHKEQAGLYMVLDEK